MKKSKKKQRSPESPTFPTLASQPRVIQCSTNTFQHIFSLVQTVDAVHAEEPVIRSINTTTREPLTEISTASRVSGMQEPKSAAEP